MVFKLFVIAAAFPVAVMARSQSAESRLSAFFAEMGLSSQQQASIAAGRPVAKVKKQLGLK